MITQIQYKKLLRELLRVKKGVGKEGIILPKGVKEGKSPQQLLDALSLEVSTKKHWNRFRLKEDIALGITDVSGAMVDLCKDFQVVNGSYRVPKNQATQLNHAVPFPRFNFEGFEDIAAYEPVLVIKRYKPARNTFRYRRGRHSASFASSGYKRSIDSKYNLIRPSQISLTKNNAHIDLGLQHYFSLDYGGTPQYQWWSKYFINGITARGGRKKPMKSSAYVRNSKNCVYLQFQVEIKVDGKTYISKPLSEIRVNLNLQDSAGHGNYWGSVYYYVKGNITVGTVKNKSS